MGLLSFINPEDEGQRQRNIAFFQQLAQAGAPSATQNSWALGLANGFGEGNKAQLAHQRYAGTQDLQKQEIDMNKLRLDAYKQEQERKDKLRQFMSGLNGGGNTSQPEVFNNAAIGAHMSGGDAFSPETIASASKNYAAQQASGGHSPAWQRYQGVGDQLSAAGFVEEAKPYYEMADKWKPKYKADTIRDSKTGRTFMLADDGSSLDTGMTASEKAHFGDTGGKIVAFDPYTGLPIAGSGATKTMTPGESASNAVAWANYGLGNQRLSFDQSQAVPSGTNKAPPGYRWKSDGSLEPIPGGPQDLKAGSQSAKQADAKDVLSLLDMAEPLIKKATGSYAGAGADMAANVFGFSTEGANAASQLQALEGMLVSKMPKMSGPQSDKDVLLYKQMAGQIGDPTVPASRKQAAMQTIRQINERYAGIEPKQQAANAPRSKFFNVGGKQMAGQLGADGNYYVTQNGKRYRIEE